jgi:hypothetical protein
MSHEAGHGNCEHFASARSALAKRVSRSGVSCRSMEIASSELAREAITERLQNHQDQSMIRKKEDTQTGV